MVSRVVGSRMWCRILYERDGWIRKAILDMWCRILYGRDGWIRKAILDMEGVLDMDGRVFGNLDGGVLIGNLDGGVLKTYIVIVGFS
jgi:hypothetical protein